ncbi:MAG: NADP-dependent oxidoreductase, partial [Nitrospinaceae bacterium]|nr:NADP-dependent oxidoreductase [Nitrospinaceae bacterium]
MKAILMNGYGGPEVLQYGDTPDPAAGSGEIVVDIHAASLNPSDWKSREGRHGSDPKMLFPHILGRDFSGVVREAGPGVGYFSKGDAVFGVLDSGQEGAYAEALAIKAEIVAIKPPVLSHIEAAAFSLIGLTALIALEDTAQLKSGETILIHGGAGGVGGFAVQYARHIGAKVFTTASARNHDYVRLLGADEAIDYSTQDFTEVVPKCDVVFDTIGGEVHARSFSVLKSGGRLIHVANGPEGFEPPQNDVTAIRPKVPRDRKHLERIVELVESGALKSL